MVAQVDGLLAGRPYKLRVRSANARGPGAWSEPTTTATAPAPPPAPAPPTFGNRTVSSVRARWDLTEDDNGSAVNRYRCRLLLVFGYAQAWTPKRHRSQVGHERFRVVKGALTSPTHAELRLSDWSFNTYSGCTRVRANQICRPLLQAGGPCR